MNPVSKSSAAPQAPFRWTAAPSDHDKDRIRIADGWAVDNITSWACEPLARATGGKSRIVSLNYQVREDFDALWAAWEAQGLLALMGEIVWSGGWVPRYKRGLTPAQHDQQMRHLSNHSSGHAFDICAQRYPRGVYVDARDPIHRLVQVATQRGWKCGIDFPTTDPMHIQHPLSPFP